MCICFKNKFNKNDTVSSVTMVKKEFFPSKQPQIPDKMSYSLTK